MKMKKIVIIITIVSGIFFSCKKSAKDNQNPIPGVGGNGIDTIGTVYAAGYEYNTNTGGSIGIKVAKYWKNNSTINLTNGTYNASATAITLVGTDIYTAGYEKNAAGKSVAKYWKNTAATNITDGNFDAITTGLVIVGADIYIAGYEKNAANINVAKYWKNGIAINLSGGSKDAKATAITIVGGDVYVAGYELNAANIAVAKYWKNGTAVILSNGIDATVANGIAVVGTDVYVVGGSWHYSFGGDPRGIGKYWKNGVSTNLTTIGAANSIYVKGTDIFITGCIDLVPTYWKNGISNSLTHSSSYFNIPTSISVLANKVYITGYADSYGQGYYYAVIGTYDGAFNSEKITNRYQGQIFSMYVVQ
jgi:hypothetical protein